MKTKTNISPTLTGTGAYTYVLSHDGSGGSGFYNRYSFKEFDETISYGIGRRQNNPCNHVSVVTYRNTASFTSQIPYVVAGVVHPMIYTMEPNCNYVNMPESSYPALVLDDSTWRERSSRAVQAMWPEVESRVSSLNFAIELPEVRNIPDSFRRLSSFVNDSLKKIAKPSRKLTLKRIVSSLSEGALLSEFAIRPLLSDIFGFTEVMAKARADADRILSNEGKQLVSHYREQLTGVSPSSTDHVDVNQGSGLAIYVDRYTRTYVRRNAWYYATMRYSYALLNYQRELAHVLALYDALGLNLNPTVLWNALPWSFVVDWFARVGDFLEQTKLRNLEPVVSIHSFVHTKKIEYDLAFDCELGRGYNGPARAVMYGRRVSSYLREPTVPDTYTAIQLSGLNTREFILGGALFGVRR